MDVELKKRIQDLTDAKTYEERVRILEVINKLFNKGDTPPELQVVTSTNLIELLALTLEEDMKWATEENISGFEIIFGIYRSKRWEIPKVQTAHLVRVLKAYLRIRVSKDILTLVNAVVQTNLGRQAMYKDLELYDMLKAISLDARHGAVLQHMSAIIISWAADHKEYQLRIINDSKFIADMLSAPNVNGYWAILEVLCHHPDAKSLLPRQEIIQKAFETTENNIQRPSVIALLCNENDLTTLQLDSTYVETRTSELKKLLDLQHEQSWISNCFLLLILLPFVNLSIADANKGVLGPILIPLLLRVLQIRQDQPLSINVSTDLDQSRCEAAKTLWNLAFNKANRALIKEIGGLDILESTSAYGTSDTLKRNIEGVLFMFTDFEPPLPHARTTAKHIMISYNWDNQPTVRKLCAALRAYGYNVWLDVEQMKGSVLEAMAEAIEGADMVLMCVTQKYKDSPNCRLEGEYCVKRAIPFIPLLMQKDYKADGWLGIAMGNKLYYNFTSEADWDNKIESLVKVIGNVGKGLSGSLRDSKSKSTTQISVVTEEWEHPDLLAWMQREKIEAFYEAGASQGVDKTVLLEIKAILLQNPASAMAIVQQLFYTTRVSDVLRITSAIRKL